jgi:hypothetical protein
MHDITTYGLYGWSKSLFEKLGWMTLAHQDCQLIQLKCYVENIHLLIQHIELKLQYLHGLHKKQNSYHGLEEKINDMEILHENMKVLQKHAEHLVKTCKKEKVVKSVKSVKKVSGKKMMKGGNTTWYEKNTMYNENYQNFNGKEDELYWYGRYISEDVNKKIIDAYNLCKFTSLPTCDKCKSISKYIGIIYQLEGSILKNIKCKFICNGENHHEGYL